MQVVRTRLPGEARGTLIIVGALVVLFGLFSVFVEYSGGSCEFVGEREVNPDGTVTYWDPEGNTDIQYDLRAEDGSNYSGVGPAFVWIIGRGGVGIEPVYEGSTPEEAEAFIRSQGEVFFTGSPAEAEAWAQAEREVKRATCWRGDAAVVAAGLLLLAVGVWPSTHRRDDTRASQ